MIQAQREKDVGPVSRIGDSIDLQNRHVVGQLDASDDSK